MTPHQYCPGKTRRADPKLLKLLMKVTVVRFFDFNSKPPFCHHFAAFQLFSEAAYEYGTNCLFATDGLFSTLRISSLCQSLSRQSLRQELFLQRSVPLSGLCPTYLPRKSARYRSLLAGTTIQALSHGLSRSRLPHHAGRCQREPRLAHLPRFRP